MKGQLTNQERRRRSAMAHRMMSGGMSEFAAERLRRIRQRAKLMGESTIETTVRFLIAVRDGQIAGCTAGDRVRAAENLLDRFGAPRLQATTATVDFPSKLIDIAGWGVPTDTVKKLERSKAEEVEANGDDRKEPEPN